MADNTYSMHLGETDAERLELLIVGEGGLEPPRPEGHWHLKPARLPFRHSPENNRWSLPL